MIDNLPLFPSFLQHKKQPCRGCSPVLGILLLATLVLFACAKQPGTPADTAPASSGKSSQEADATAPKRSAQQQTVQKTPRHQKQEPSAGKAASQAATPEKSAAVLMLESAGRKPGAQPEQNFSLNVPDKVWGGEPFTVALQGDELKGITVVWRNKKITVQAGQEGQQKGRCEVALATPLDGKEQEIPLAITAQWENKTETMRVSLPVDSRKYPVQRLTVAQKYVTPDPSVLDRIKRDRQEISAVLRQVTPHRYWALPFQRPVPGAVSSVFGLRRFFNGQPRNPHKGIDFRAAAGDPVAAVEAGRVALVADHYYGGNTVIIDHGLGVYSLYLHLSAFDVQKGQVVARGESVGRIGSTGRSTGPHLHLSLAVLGESVNAARVIQGM